MTATRHRRAITAAVTLTVGVIVVGVMAVVGFRNLTAPIQDGATTEEVGCPAGQQLVSKEFLRRGEVQVSVYNAGGVKGAASRTMKALEKGGFQAGEVANAPEDVKVNVARVYSTRENDPAARLVARFLGKNVGVRHSDKNYGPGVDVFIGKNQGAFNRKAKRTIRLEEPITSCEPVEDEKKAK